MVRKIISVLIIVELIFSQTGIVYGNPGLVADFLYDMAMQYYRTGNFKDALHEASKILLVEPDNKAAVRLIGQIKRKQLIGQSQIETEPEKAEEIITQGKQVGEDQNLVKLTEWEKFNQECLAVEAAFDKEAPFPEALEEMKEPKIIRKVAAPIIVETQKKPVKVKEAAKKESIANEGEIYEVVPAAGAISPQALGIGKKPISIENIIPETKNFATEEEAKPVVIAMEQILPKPKVAPQEWIIKPEEMVTSNELEEYHLFDESKLFINAKQVEITPIIIKNSTIRLPLEKLAKTLGLVVFSPEKETLTVINADGLPIEFRVGKKEVLLNKQKFAVLQDPILKYKGWTMLALEDLSSAIGLQTKRDDNKIMITSKESPQSNEFITFTNAKPKEEKKPEEAKASFEEPSPVLGRLTAVPAQLQPDIRLQVNNNVNSAYNNLTKKFLQSDELTIAGDIYDYKLYSNFKWKQTDTNHFINDGKYIGLFNEYLWLEFLNLSAVIPHLRGQMESYEGAQITGFYKPFSTKVYAGERDITVSGPPAIGAVRYYGHILGVEQKYSTDTLEIIQNVIGTEANAETQVKSGTTDFPRKNIISVTDATLKLPYRIDLSGQFGFSNYYPDNNRDTSVYDHDWRLQAKMDGEKLYWDWRYEFVGDKYASLGNPEMYQDYKGWDLYSRYKLTKKLYLTGGYSESQDNVDSINTEPTNKNRNLSLGANFSLSGNTNLGFNWLKGETETKDPITGSSSMKTYDYLLSLSRSWTDWMLLLTFDRYKLESQTGYFSDTGSISLYKFMPNLRGSYLRARHQIRKTSYEDPASSDSTDYGNDFGFRYYFLRNLSIYGNLALNDVRTEEQEKRDAISLTSGIQWDINRDVGFGFDFSLAPYDLSNKDNRNSRAWSTLFRFFSRFEITSPAKWGKIRGRIFKDSNGNGKYDTGEPVLPGVTVRVPDEFIAQTNNNGLYVLDEIIPGAKTVIIEMKDLPIELIPPEGSVLNIVVEPRKTIVLNFPLVEASSIVGRVFIDADNDGVYDLGEEGLEGMSIYLSPKARKVDTDENGYFFFEFISPGKYEVTLDVSQLPIEYKLASSEKIQIQLMGKQVSSDANFRVISKPIVTKKF